MSSARATLLSCLCAVALVDSSPQSPDARGAGVWLNIAAGRPLLPAQLPIKLGGVDGVSLPVLLLPVPVPPPPGTCAAPPAHPAPAAPAVSHQHPAAPVAATHVHALHAKYTVKEEANGAHPQPDLPNTRTSSPERFSLFESPSTTMPPAVANEDRVPWLFSPSPFAFPLPGREAASLVSVAPTVQVKAEATLGTEPPSAVRYLKNPSPFFPGFGTEPPPPPPPSPQVLHGDPHGTDSV